MTTSSSTLGEPPHLTPQSSKSRKGGERNPTAHSQDQHRARPHPRGSPELRAGMGAVVTVPLTPRHRQRCTRSRFPSGAGAPPPAGPDQAAEQGCAVLGRTGLYWAILGCAPRPPSAPARPHLEAAAPRPGGAVR